MFSLNRPAASSQEQAAGLAEINIAVNQLDQVTQQNAAMFEQTTAASHSLSRGSEALTAAMAQFRVSGGEAAPAIQTAKFQSARPRRTMAGAASPMAAKSALAVAPRPAEDEWEDF